MRELASGARPSAPRAPTPAAPPGCTDEEPLAPELVIDARDEEGQMQSAEDMAADIMAFLEERGYLGSGAGASSGAEGERAAATA